MLSIPTRTHLFVGELTGNDKNVTDVAPEALPPRIVDAYLQAVRDLAKTVGETDVDRSRAQLRDLLGAIEVEATEKEIRFITKKGAVEGNLSRMAGGPSVFVVAGARVGIRAPLISLTLKCGSRALLC